MILLNVQSMTREGLAVRNEAQKLAKRKYEQSEKGKAAKKRHEATYVASGGRAEAEKRRSAKPLTEAKRIAKLKYQLVRRGSEKTLSIFDEFVLKEAISLARLREQMLGTKRHVDHIIPVSKGGASTYDNIQVVPALWNRRKSNKHTGLFFTRA